MVTTRSMARSSTLSVVPVEYVYKEGDEYATRSVSRRAQSEKFASLTVTPVDYTYKSGDDHSTRHRRKPRDAKLSEAAHPSMGYKSIIRTRAQKRKEAAWFHRELTDVMSYWEEYQHEPPASSSNKRVAELATFLAILRKLESEGRLSQLAKNTVNDMLPWFNWANSNRRPTIEEEDTDEHEFDYAGVWHAVSVAALTGVTYFAVMYGTIMYKDELFQVAKSVQGELLGFKAMVEPVLANLTHSWFA